MIGTSRHSGAWQLLCRTSTPCSPGTHSRVWNRFQRYSHACVEGPDACVMLLAAMVVVVNFVVDLLYAAIDPRVKARGL